MPSPMHNYWIRVIRGKGRPMTLQRQTGVNPTVYTTASVTGIMHTYRPDQISGDIRQGDSEVRILDDDIVTAGWPGPPHAKDSIIIDGKTWLILGSQELYDGTELCAHWLWVRGGIG